MHNGIAIELHAIFLASFQAFCRCYNLSMGTIDWHRWDWRSAPSGVSLQDVLLSRYALSVHETVQILLLEGRVANMHVIAFDNMVSQHGRQLAELARARFETNHRGPTWDAITAAALAFANRRAPSAPDATAIRDAYTRGA